MPSEPANSNGVKDEIELVGLGPENSNGSAMLERADVEGYACNGDGTYLGAGEKVLDECAVELEHIRKTYNLEGRDEQVVALKEINICHESEIYPIMKGEFLILRGPSGGGKTTLLNMIGCIDNPTSGVLRLFGDKITAETSDSYLAKLRLAKIGFVFQTFNLLATMSAFENVELPMTLLGVLNKKQRQKRAVELLTTVGLWDRMDHLPSELSGGEQQRVAIARALANKPELLLLDEPTGDLDTRNTIDVMDILLDINLKQRTTLVMVTHNPDIECYADRVLYLQDGQCVKQALNESQCRLEFTKYMDFLNSKQADP
ncbi:hypothetical protein GUITHDRAFT_163277 [Guillardia theta CCMP2712]|uniref:ABC transporter domain-containing protein n=1 Tax=Guillardia theta (strain CCMP2712) TaxID=905079 RepID=L1JAS9_GUITC|nr:hypothetical protein GUITHDRAFT_163277 [Guillardia theta CCMP2712]EKX45412.1 hypothetical protein GUITHDRAFT_163277 [Guillardia theta CCMP2712]|mmetsp:Transcript_27293/g.89114  ORF Transcript_27293/g.89114 Transcript_27293/m.89114 type:complete len:317 (-) Transcript_27293:120-1070(-)|eukprot:XP_005832392.1 hypothetical protein GUITHDRAFT_163277 [Guillardia theta CCMP2712]